MSAEHLVHSYACETCGEPVTLTHSEFLRLRGGKWGAKVRCGRCVTTPSPYMIEKTTQKEGLTATGRASPSKRDRTYPPVTAQLNLNPDERMDYGVTVTIREQTTRELDTVVGVGPVRNATLACAALIDAREGTWKVVSVSSPSSIFRDLQGARNVDGGAALPESEFFGRVGRPELVERPLKPRRGG